MWKVSEHGTSQEAWEYINEYLANHGGEIHKNGGGRLGGANVISYDHFFRINTLWVDPSFDFGRMFNYKFAKWSSLVSNYINLNDLDITRDLIIEKEAKASKEYNIAFNFSNKHGHGKGCLINLLFQRRFDRDNPLITLTTRSSEVTKRLLLDLLLVQRISEYIYGDTIKPSLDVICRSLYLHGETFTTYSIHKPLEKFLGNKDKYSLKLWEVYNKLLTIDPDKVTYKVVKRAVKQIQTNPNGSPISGSKKMVAGKLFLLDKKYPEEIFSPIGKKLYNKNKLKNGKIEN